MNIYRTDNLGLCPFLEMNGLKYLRAEPALGKNDKPVVMFLFEDPAGVGPDLEFDFVKGPFKKYRDMLFYFRNEIEKMQRKLDRIQRDENRDDKFPGAR